MKRLLTLSISFCVIVNGALGQAAGVFEKPYDAGADCQTLSLNAAAVIADGFLKYNMDEVDKAVATVAASCGISEVTMRAKILSKIVRRKSVNDEIRMFYTEEYYRKTESRITTSKSADYGYHYTGRESYYGFVPLGHRVDSIMGNVAIELMAVRSLTDDERLMCILFSGDVEKFEKEWKKSLKHPDMYAGTYRKEMIRSHDRTSCAMVLSSGFYSPVGSRKVIGTNPSFGISFSSPIEYKLSLDLAMKVRIHNNDQGFDYYAMGQTNNVNSSSALFLGLVTGVKHYDTRKFMVQSRYGLGLEVINTGLKEKVRSGGGSTSNDDYDYHDLETLHTSVGLAAFRSINNGRHIGVEVGLHFCPYQLDRNLQTPLDNIAASGELFFRF
jgi:hypothetical protein